MATEDLSHALNPERTAHIVVDVQNAFASEDSPLIDRGVDISAAIETTDRTKELLDFSRDIGLTIAFTRSIRRADQRDDPAETYRIVPDVYSADETPLCCAGASDAEYVSGFEPRAEEYEVKKKRYNGFHGTPLDYYLRNEGIDTVLLSGFTTDVCVEGTARGAHERGYDVCLVEDCCAAFSPEDHAHTVKFVERNLGTSATLEELREVVLGNPATSD